jgi:DNA repair protein RecN (Recombination protein N)
MLRHLTIRNLAIIDAVELEFSGGFTVLTGETGAGKSILIDALGLAIGTRADPGLVRAGTERAEISAEFSLNDAPEARAWLADHEMLDEDNPDTVLVRRVVGRDGRTRAFINSSTASTTALRELGERLIEVFGQNEGQTLLRGDVQRELLDGFSGDAAPGLATAAAARAWQDTARRIEQLRATGPRDPAQLEFLRYQLRELEALNLGADELTQLDADHKRLANAERLLSEGNRALESLDGGDATACDLLASAAQALGGLAEFDAEFDAVAELVGSAQTQAREAAKTLQRLLDRLELDPAQLAQIERRLSDIQALARKHRVRAEALPQRMAELRHDMDEAELAGAGLDLLERELEQRAADYRRAAEQLTQQRRASAERFAAAITEQVRQLGMPNAQLGIVVEPAPEGRPRAQGADEVRFDFSANPGQPPRPLAKVASGGELSRISLAIQVTALQSGGPSTMIFDEVDAGIGGAVAAIVGSRLRALGRQRQVLSVTHLAQVAAHGHQHLGIVKEVERGQTYTRIQPLEREGRVTEIARMSGGVELTAATRSLAAEMLERAADGV